MSKLRPALASLGILVFPACSGGHNDSNDFNVSSEGKNIRKKVELKFPTTTKDRNLQNRFETTKSDPKNK